MKAKSLLKRVNILMQRKFVEPYGPVTYSEEWILMRDFTSQFLEHRFPDAYLAFIAAVDQLEVEDREREPPKHTRGKAKWLDTKEGRMHSLVCKLGSYGALGPYLDARIALASALDELEKQHA